MEWVAKNKLGIPFIIQGIDEFDNSKDKEGIQGTTKKVLEFCKQIKSERHQT